MIEVYPHLNRDMLVEMVKNHHVRGEIEYFRLCASM